MSDLKKLAIKRNGDTRVFNGSWYRGPNTNFIPNKADLATDNALDDYILYGWGPSEPFISPAEGITSFGSCFAAHATSFLSKKGFNVFCRDESVHQSHLIRFGEGMVNTFAIRQQIEWGFDVKDFPDGLWFGPNKEIATPSEESRAKTRAILEATDVFIITLGLSEIWYDKVTGDAFWRAIPKDMFDGSRHGFRVASVAENRDNLEQVLALIRQKRPHAKIVFTLSPVKLVATFRPVSCLTASSASKAILRAAVDEVMQRNSHDSNLFYFPAYEIVHEFFESPFQDDNRHPRDEVVNTVLKTFYRHYCLPPESGTAQDHTAAAGATTDAG